MPHTATYYQLLHGNKILCSNQPFYVPCSNYCVQYTTVRAQGEGRASVVEIYINTKWLSTTDYIYIQGTMTIITSPDTYYIYIYTLLIKSYYYYYYYYSRSCSRYLTSILFPFLYLFITVIVIVIVIVPLPPHRPSISLSSSSLSSSSFHLHLPLLKSTARYYYRRGFRPYRYYYRRPRRYYYRRGFRPRSLALRCTFDRFWCWSCIKSSCVLLYY